MVIALAIGFWLKLAGPKTARVPLGIAGFELGMKLEQTRKLFPKLEPLAEHQFRTNTSLFDEAAACTLSFPNDQTLTEIKCSLEAGQTPERRRQLRGKVLTTMRKLYSEETSASAALGVEHWEWTNDRALLTLDMPPVLSDAGRIEVSNKLRW